MLYFCLIFSFSRNCCCVLSLLLFFLLLIYFLCPFKIDVLLEEGLVLFYSQLYLLSLALCLVNSRLSILYTDWMTKIHSEDSHWSFTMCRTLCQALVYTHWVRFDMIAAILNFVIDLKETSAFLVAQTVENLPVVPETQVHVLGQEDPLEKGMAVLFCILAWRIP